MNYDITLYTRPRIKWMITFDVKYTICSFAAKSELFTEAFRLLNSSIVSLRCCSAATSSSSSLRIIFSCTVTSCDCLTALCSSSFSCPMILSLCESYDGINKRHERSGSNFSTSGHSRDGSFKSKFRNLLIPDKLIPKGLLNCLK